MPLSAIKQAENELNDWETDNFENFYKEKKNGELVMINKKEYKQDRKAKEEEVYNKYDLTTITPLEAENLFLFFKPKKPKKSKKAKKEGGMINDSTTVGKVSIGVTPGFVAKLGSIYYDAPDEGVSNAFGRYESGIRWEGEVKKKNDKLVVVETWDDIRRVPSNWTFFLLKNGDPIDTLNEDQKKSKEPINNIPGFYDQYETKFLMKERKQKARWLKQQEKEDKKKEKEAKKKEKEAKKEGGMYRLGHQFGLYVTGQAPTWRPPSSSSLQPPGLQDPNDVFQTDVASPAFQSEQIEYENAKKLDAEVRKRAREDFLARINHRPQTGRGVGFFQRDPATAAHKEQLKTMFAKINKALPPKATGSGWGAVEGYNPDGTKMTKEQKAAYLNRLRAPLKRPITQLDTGPLTGSGFTAPLLKEFIDLSYRGNTSIAPAGYDIDSPLSDSRVKVYAKKGSNDKDIVVTHRGSVGLDDWMDNASYMFRGKVKGTKTYNLHRDRHKRAVDKYGASNITAIGHSRAGLYLQELQKEFPIKENITYNKASGFTDIGRQNAANQTDVRVGNDIVSLLAPLQRRQNAIVNISGTKNPFDFNAAHQTAEINKVGDQFIGKQEGSGTLPVISSVEGLQRLIKVEQARLRKIAKGYEYESSTMTKEKIQEKIARLKDRLKSARANKGHADVSYFIPKSIKWLKIMATETRLGSDAYNKMLLDAINKLLTELGAKKQTPATKKKTATLNEDRVELEQMIKPKKKGYSKKTPDANKPNPVIIPVSSLTNERANIRAATQRQRNYNKVLSDKEEENINVMIKAFSPIPQAPQAPEAPRSKADERREKARLRAAQQRQEPGHNARQVEINRANRERTRLAKSIGVPIQEYSRAQKEYVKNERIIASLEDEAQRQVIRDAQRALAAKYKFSYLDEVVSSDNTVPNMVIAADAGPPPVVVESEVEPAVAPIVGSGMYGGSLGYSGRDPKYIMSGKNEEYYLLH